MTTEAQTGNDIVAAAWADFELFVAKHIDELEDLPMLEVISRYSAYRTSSHSRPDLCSGAK